MIKERNGLRLDYIVDLDDQYKNDVYGIAKGLKIMAKEGAGYVDVAHIKWDSAEESCYIRTVKDGLQTYIVKPEAYVDFIYLVDEAYDRLGFFYKGPISEE